MSARWVKAVSGATLRAKGRALFRHEGRQIALFDTANGVFACNNRCPHEGYPLTEGHLDDACALTCNWHNWKFDLASGANLFQGDRLRVYPVEVRDGDIWLDLSEPPLADRRAELLDSLHAACDDNDYERMARELARLDRLGADPLTGTRSVVARSADRMRYGWTHAFAGMADWLAIADETPADPEAQMVCRLEGIGHVADDVLREPHYPFCETIAEYDEDGFVAAVEAMDEERAGAMIRGALGKGLGFSGVERGLTRAALAHYNAFGHSLIYVTKAQRLIERLGDSLAEPLLLSLVRQFVFAAREDLIPEFRAYADCLARWANGASGDPGDADLRPESWRKLGIDKALERTVAASASEPLALYHALLGTSALNLLAFDLDHQHEVHVPVSDNVGWLDYTHAVTFGNALRTQCEKFPELWAPGLLQLTCFSGRAAAFTRSRADTGAWRVDDPEAFFDTALEKLIDHGVGEYIVSVHYVKTLLAAREEYRRGLPGAIGASLLAAMNRLLNSPLRLKQPRRAAHQALKFVELDG